MPTEAVPTEAASVVFELSVRSSPPETFEAVRKKHSLEGMAKHRGT